MDARVRPLRSGARRADKTRLFGSQDGIILLDVVLALAVLSFIVLLIVPRLSSGTTAARHSGYVLEVAAVLKTDRTAAARSGREVASLIDVAQRTVASGSSGRRVQLPTDLELDVIASDTCTKGPGLFAIAFAADGRSCGAVIRIAKSGQDWRIRINWLTGFVDVVAPHAG